MITLNRQAVLETVVTSLRSVGWGGKTPCLAREDFADAFRTEICLDAGGRGWTDITLQVSIFNEMLRSTANRLAPNSWSKDMPLYTISHFAINDSLPVNWSILHNQAQNLELLVQDVVHGVKVIIEPWLREHCTWDGMMRLEYHDASFMLPAAQAIALKRIYGKPRQAVELLRGYCEGEGLFQSELKAILDGLRREVA